MHFSLEPGGKYAVMQGDQLEEVREHFSVKNDAAPFTRKYCKFVPARYYAITPTGRFDPPLLLEILKFLLSTHCGLKIVVEDTLKAAISPSEVNWQGRPLFNPEPYKLTLDLRDYQEEIVRKCLQAGRGTVVLATAGGKTLAMASLISRVSTFYSEDAKFKCLVIVPDIGLVHQTYNDFLSYNVPFTFSKWTGNDDLQLASNVIIANAGILQSEKSNTTWIDFVDLLVVDEVHKIRKGNKITDLIKAIKTPCKFGFTGTMPESLLDQWNIIGKIGSVLYERDSNTLRKDKYIADVCCQIIELSHNSSPEPVSDKMKAYRSELEFIINSSFRNNLIAKLANNVTKNCLILIDFIRHGNILEEVLKKKCTDKQVFFIQGSVEVDEREKIKQLMEANANVVVIAISKIFSTGINIKNLHYILFAGGGKAKIRVVQSIGRGLRLHATKTKLILLDIADNLKYGNRHAGKRQNLYEKENIPFTIKEIKET
jgi:superfamily II DNA or RNA helicase